MNPRDEKMRLAFEITKMYNGENEANKAQNDFINVVQNKCIPDDIAVHKITDAINILDLLLQLNFVPSKGEAKRLIQGGGVKFEGEKISDNTFIVEKSGVLQAGKRKYAKLEFQK